MKARDQVLKTILELDYHKGEFFNLRSSLELAHPDLSPEELADILKYLQKMNLIGTPAHKIKGSLRFIKVLPEAYIYFQQKEDRLAEEAAAREEAREKALEEIYDWEDRTWKYKMIAIGYFAGLVSGILLMWLRGVFFP